MHVLLVGPPGAGKGTQAHVLEARTGIKHVASGDLLRWAIRAQSPLGQQAGAYVDRGALVPDELVVELIRERIGRPDCTAGVILDGFPRTRDQTRVLEQMLATQDQAIAAVIYLNAPRDVLLKRIAGRLVCHGCQASYNIYYAPSRAEGICDLCRDGLYERSDDKWATARHRLEVYLQQTLPMIAYYRERRLLHEIDATGHIDTVTEQVLTHLQLRRADA